MGKKIVVVEDDPGARRLISYTLEQEGYNVQIASNGLEGLKKALEEKPDVIVLDVMLPGLDGFELCHRLRQDSRTAQTPILMLSAKAQEADISTGRRLGADDYLTKPADPSEIAKRVANLLVKKSHAES